MQMELEWGWGSDLRGDSGGDSCKCGAFITVAVTAGGICGNLDIWMGEDADPAAEKSGYAPEAAGRVRAQGGEKCFRKEIAAGGTRGEREEWRRRPQLAYKRGVPSRSGFLPLPVLPNTGAFTPLASPRQSPSLYDSQSRSVSQWLH